MTDTAIREFLETLNTEVHDRASGISGDGSADFSENAFTQYVTELLSEVASIADADVVHYEGRIGRSIAKVNGYSISIDGSAFDIFTSIFLNTVQPVDVPASDIRQAFERAARFIGASLDSLHSNLEPATDEWSMARSIHDARTAVERIRVHVLTDGVAGKFKLGSSQAGDIRVDCELWDAERLSSVMRSGLSRDEIFVDFSTMPTGPLPALSVPETSDGYKAWLSVMPGDVLFRLYEEYGPRLLEFNVRAFMQARGNVNRGIRNSLRDEPEVFVAYNNGVVITADGLETVVLGNGVTAISKIQGMQIVNGGQTTASIHQAAKRDRLDVSAVFVAAKIIVPEPECLNEMVPNISRYANTQNVIQLADFSAGHPFHIRIEELSRRIHCPGGSARWFYERARGQYNTELNRFGTTPSRKKRFKEQMPPARKFTKTDLSRYIVTWDCKPDQVSRGAQKNFVLFMQNLDNDLSPDETFYRNLISKVIIYKTVQRIVRQEQFPAYRVNIVNYLTALLSDKYGDTINLDMIWNRQQLSPELEAAIRSWSHDVSRKIIDSSNGRNVTEWAKKNECWDAVRSIDADIHTSFPPELG